jgi:hypothetical protein
MLSALSYHPGRIWSRIGSVDVCLTFIEEDFGSCQGIEMIWPNDLSADREFVDVYGNTHVVGYLYIDLEQERILMSLDYHSWGIFGYAPNCIGPDDHPGYSEEYVLGCMRALDYNLPPDEVQEEHRQASAKICLEEAIWPQSNVAEEDSDLFRQVDNDCTTVNCPEVSSHPCCSANPTF